MRAPHPRGAAAGAAVVLGAASPALADGNAGTADPAAVPEKAAPDSMPNLGINPLAEVVNEAMSGLATSNDVKSATDVLGAGAPGRQMIGGLPAGVPLG